MSRRLLARTFGCALLLAAAGCGGGGSDERPEDAATQDLSGVTAEGTVGDDLSVTLDSPIKSEESQAAVLTEGTGHPLQTNDVALVHLYVGNGSNGKQVANTYESGPPVQLAATEGELFEVILEEVVGRPAGSRVAITAPASDVWGAQGAPQLAITGEDTVVFVADIVSVQPDKVHDGPFGADVEPPEGAPMLVEEDGEVTGFDWSQAPEKAPRKLTVIPLVEGSGPKVRAESMVTVDYYGAVYGDDKPFDESFSAEPVPFGVGVNQLIAAWDKTIPGLTLGSRVLIIAPPEDGYGDEAQPDIPANSTLVYVIDVLGVDE